MSDKIEKKKPIILEDIRKKYHEAIDALKKINEEELNSQRPGGGYSKSAQISYNILNKLGEWGN